MESNRTLWNEAGKAGLVLGSVSLVYMVIDFLVTKGQGQSGWISAAMTVLWAAKLWLCLWLLKFFLTRYSANNPEIDNSGTFRFGMAVAFLSALLYSGGQLAWVTLVQPDMFADSIALVEESIESMMTDDMIDTLEEIVPKMPTISFFLSLFWCWIFGTCFSAIFSRNIPSRNPFDK